MMGDGRVAAGDFIAYGLWTGMTTASARSIEPWTPMSQLSQKWIVQRNLPCGARCGDPKSGVIGPEQRGHRPDSHVYDRIGDYPESDIQAILNWIASDGILRSDDEMLVAAFPILGFARRGKLIDERLRRSITRW
jgi:hypothetical protein